MKIFKNFSRQTILMITVLCFAFAFTATAAFAALTMSATTVSSDAALTLTGAAASTWSTSAGALTIDSAAALNLGTTNATSVTIGNTTADLVTAVGNLQVTTPVTLSISGTAPATPMKLQYAATGALASAFEAMQVVATYNNAAAASGGITGLEVKARQTSTTGGSLPEMRGIIATADVKDRTATTIEGMEANVASSTGATATNVYGLRVTQQLAADGAGSSNIYGVDIQADNVANTADIRLSGGANATIRPTISAGPGVPDNATCTASVNLGSLYIHTGGTAGAHTLLYVCTESGNWVAVQSTTGF